MNDNPNRRDFLRGFAAAAVGADLLCVGMFDFHVADNAALAKKVLGKILSRTVHGWPEGSRENIGRIMSVHWRRTRRSRPMRRR